jgi:pyruvate decarboxylase
MEAEYNDIANWDFKALVDVFGGSKTSKKFAVETKDELEKLLTDESFNAAECLQFVELYMPKEDAPRALKLTAEASARNNAKKA